MSDTQLEVDDMSCITEIHTHKYSVAEDDNSIVYTEDILYSWLGNIEVEGEFFHSVNQRQVIHGQGIDDYARRVTSLIDLLGSGLIN